MQSKIVMDNWEGFHNQSDYASRLEAANSYKDQSTICVIPTRGVIPAIVVQNWLGMMIPMNQKFMRMFMIGLEVGAAYSQAIEMVLTHPELSTWKYLLTMEEDNTVPPDGLLKLLAEIEDWDALGGLYWTKGEGGQPMCYGVPGQLNFIPQIPAIESTTRCNGLGMGFTLFKMEFLKKMREKFPGQPLFQTKQVYEPGKGSSAFTQDLFFFQNAMSIGARVGCSSKVKCGHFDLASGIIW